MKYVEKESGRISGIEGENILHARMPDTWEVNKNISPVIRERKVIMPLQHNHYADRAIFNPGIVEHEGKMHILARVIGSVDKGKYISHLLHGVEVNEREFHFDPKPILDLTPREDPRIVKIGDEYLIPHTVVRGKRVEVGLASTKDFVEYEDHGIILPHFGESSFNKDVVILPERVKDKVAMFIRIKPGIQVVYFESIDEIKELGKEPKLRDEFWSRYIENYKSDWRRFTVLDPRMSEMRELEERWNFKLVEYAQRKLLTENMELHPEVNKIWYGSGPTPIKTEHGWLCFPHRGQFLAKFKEGKGDFLNENLKLYVILATLHELDDPTQLKGIYPIPILIPNPNFPLDTEIPSPYTRDAIPYVHFCTGAIRRDGNNPEIVLAIGINDIFTNFARVSQKALIDGMKRI